MVTPRPHAPWGYSKPPVAQRAGGIVAELENTWILLDDDSLHVHEVLRRWRFHYNVANGTRGFP